MQNSQFFLSLFFSIVQSHVAPLEYNAPHDMNIISTTGLYIIILLYISNCIQYISLSNKNAGSGLVELLYGSIPGSKHEEGVFYARDGINAGSGISVNKSYRAVLVGKGGDDELVVWCATVQFSLSLE